MSQLFVDNIKEELVVWLEHHLVLWYWYVTAGFDINGTADISGNVSIGGTLTYEDVTNIDAVGIITAQQGIKVGAGQSISAVSGTIYYYGDGSNLDGVVSGVETKEGGNPKGTYRFHLTSLVLL